jgi:hypothetical protein
MLRLLRLSSVIALLLTLLTSASNAQRNSEWIPLGDISVGFRVNHDIIRIGQPEEWFANRSFRALHIVADRTDVHILALRIVYLNGFAEDLRINEFIQRGEQFELNLAGERSYLKQIELVYRARPDFTGDAAIKVFADPARRGGGPSPGNWQELGCQQVAPFGKDRDTINVGRREGRFRAIRLLVRDADVEVLDLKVVYTNGQPDDLSVQSLIRAGDRTRPLDLRGRERSIDRIEMVYRSAINPGNIIAQQGLRGATVCVEGLQ